MQKEEQKIDIAQFAFSTPDSGLKNYMEILSNRTDVETYILNGEN